MRRVVVTGMGAVSPLGANVDISWSRLLAGKSGIRRLSEDIVGDLPSKIGGVVPSLAEDPGRFGQDLYTRIPKVPDPKDGLPRDTPISTDHVTPAAPLGNSYVASHQEAYKVEADLHR